LPVVLVVDTGVDDALALMVAVRHPDLDLRGVVCTAGNVQLDQVLTNTCHVLDALDARVPVAGGANCRLDGLPFEPRSLHGPDGLAGLAPVHAAAPVSLPPPAAVVPPDAVIVSLGPLTSVVPLPAGRLVASYAEPGEANHDLDPVAAHVLVASGRRVEHVRAGSGAVRAEAVSALERAGDPAGRLAAGLLRHQARRGAGLGDAGVLLSVVEPGLDPLDRLVGLLRRGH